MNDSATNGDLLTASAPLARRWAQELCGNCAPYHAFWQYLRLLGFATTPHDHADFYGARLRPLIQQGGRRVLVSGCADYAMPDLVLGVFAAEGARPSLTVVDACRTPLALCQWYAARSGLALATDCADLLSYRTAERFDIITTHVLFGHIAPEDRPLLVATWHALLGPGGRIVTANRIRPDAEPLVAYDAEAARHFRARVRTEAEKWRDRLDLTPAALATMAEEYFATRHPYAVRSVDEIVSLFEGAGFRIESSSVALAARSADAPAGPSMPGGGLYHQIVARKD